MYAPNTPSYRDKNLRITPVFDLTAEAGCSILKCIEVIASAICIADAIDDVNITKLLKCAKKSEVHPIVWSTQFQDRSF
jgi:regulator of RNase E activity RraB